MEGESKETQPPPRTFAVKKSEAEWKKELGDDAFHILREAGTEPPTGGKYAKFFPKKGYFACAGCKNPLYSASSKFDDCSWINFDKCYYQGDKCNVLTQKDYGGVEIICSGCGGHLGHVFMGERHTKTNERH